MEGFKAGNDNHRLTEAEQDIAELRDECLGIEEKIKLAELEVKRLKAMLDDRLGQIAKLQSTDTQAES